MTPDYTQGVIKSVSSQLRGIELDHFIKSRPDGDYLVFEVAQPNSNFYSIINEADQKLEPDHPFKDRIVLQERKKRPADVFEIPEIKFLRRELTQSLTVHRNTFKEDFFNRYTNSVQNYEGDIISNANFIVYGRRGAGKSSLLAYAMHKLIDLNRPVVWIAMQTYSARSDTQAIFSILSELLSGAKEQSPESTEIIELAREASILGESDDSPDLDKKLQRLIPRVRRVLGHCVSTDLPLTIFLDDLHLLDQTLQPRFLATLYSLTRDNNIYIKASGIEALTRTWDGALHMGLQSPHDLQIMRLDYNLTMPERSMAHIRDILDAHARYCGLPSISYIADEKVISRLVLAAAAVPRDALSLFSQAINKSMVRKQKSVSITSVNLSASETIEVKLRDLEQDLVSEKNEVSELLESVKKFCIEDQKKNAFLVKIDNNSTGFNLTNKLAALRFAHVLSEGTTPHSAGVRYMALMLDFGFYVGIRAAKSVALFMDEPKAISAKDLRKLPIFHPKLKT
ncbi:ATP-binding protein [Pseudomonas mosselii]|uniref:Putative ATPase n=1 Tax=Pseudomonas putida TaxID=303 RepID=A0A0N9MWU6_PSEPU|nr:ATP-binding protein [Pseudomonas mosselii]ALG76514.1 putative ATPase [Pseudomonas putida]